MSWRHSLFTVGGISAVDAGGLHLGRWLFSFNHCATSWLFDVPPVGYSSEAWPGGLAKTFGVP